MEMLSGMQRAGAQSCVGSTAEERKWNKAIVAKVKLTSDFDLHGLHAVELRHALDLREWNSVAIWKRVSPIIHAENHSRVVLK